MRKFLLVSILLVLVLLLSSSTPASAECYECYGGYMFGNFIFDWLPDNIGCIGFERTPKIITVTNVDGNWHLIYYNTDNEVQAHKYYCSKLTDRYTTCKIWKPEMNNWVYV